MLVAGAPLTQVVRGVHLVLAVVVEEGVHQIKLPEPTGELVMPPPRPEPSQDMALVVLEERGMALVHLVPVVRVAMRIFSLNGWSNGKIQRNTGYGC
jgi:hypothetical protein